jgi:GNAT superfamily N-acetyltransferase
MKHLLDNITWHTLSGHHARHAVGTQSARRYAHGFSPILGFADPGRADFPALEPFCQPGEHFYTDGWTGTLPPGWTLYMESTMFKMIWEGELPGEDASLQARALDYRHAEQALELATQTRPGPFGPRTIELGEYFGCFEGDNLIAMAGERMHAESLHEISGVCTDPAFRGKGLARRLMLLLVRRQMLRGETPFLHVMRENAGARALYEHMGFANYKESVVRVVTYG